MLLWVLESLSSKFNCTVRKQTSDSWKNSTNTLLSLANSISAATDFVSSLDYSQALTNLKSLKAYRRYLPRLVSKELSWANCIQKLILTCRRWLWLQTHRIRWFLYRFIFFSGQHVDRFLVRVPLKKTTQGRPNECQMLNLGITIKLIDRSQRNWDEFRTTNLGKMTSKVNFEICLIKVKGHSQQYMQLSVTPWQPTLINNITLIVI